MYKIADKLGYSPFKVRWVLRQPCVQKDIKRVEKRIEKALIRARVAPIKEWMDRETQKALMDIDEFMFKGGWGEDNKIHIPKIIAKITKT